MADWQQKAGLAPWKPGEKMFSNAKSYKKTGNVWGVWKTINSPWKLSESLFSPVF